MRVLRDQNVVLREQQPSFLLRVQQLWSEWEIQCLVLLSFSLQVFLLFFAVMRKRSTSRVLSVLLWLAYLSADYVAIFILGSITLHVDGKRHQLVVFWAPFLLLHLGGPDTITAFSIEDSDLWKRHLLNLVSQVALAGYVVAKQWRHQDKQLHAPMVLMFISGMIKYTERTWALYRVGSKSTPGSISVVTQASAFIVEDDYYSTLVSTLSSKKERDFTRLAIFRFGGVLDIFMDVSPSKSASKCSFSLDSVVVEGARRLQSSEDRVHMAYKLADIHLSLIYDYLYTKFGSRNTFIPEFEFSRRTKFGYLKLYMLGPLVLKPGFFCFHLCIAIQRLVCFASISAALVLFVRGVDLTKYNGADVIVSYILLVGAITLEVSAIFLGCISSYWSDTIITDAWGYIYYCCCCCCCCTWIPWIFGCSSYIITRVGGIIGTIVRRLHLQNRGEWSGNLAQYNLIGGCIQEKRAGRWEKMLRRIGIQGDTTVVAASPELMKVVLDKLLGVLTTPRVKEWDFTRFHGQWAQWALGAMHHERSSMAAQRALDASCIQDLDFVSNVIIWHYTTDLCFFTQEAAGDNSSKELRATCMELSNYILHLIAKHKLMVGSCDGLYLVGSAQQEVKGYLKSCGSIVDKYQLTLKLRNEAPDSQAPGSHRVYPGLCQARSVYMELLQIDNAYDRWELITAVWVEMLCYVAHDSGAMFHAKHLSIGGEFVTHVRMLLIILGLQYLTDLKKTIPYLTVS